VKKMSEKRKLLEKVKQAFSKGHPAKLKQLSNQAIEEAMVTGDHDLVSISIASYALYKLLTKAHYHYSKKWPEFGKNVLQHLQECCQKEKEISLVLEDQLLKDIKALETTHGHFAQDLIERAKVKQASRAYAQGMSLTAAIELTGANKFQVHDYVGKTKIHDETPHQEVKKRFEHAKKVLGGE
jgi:hypothetical protein